MSKELLIEDDFAPRFTPPEYKKDPYYEERLSELNNLGREKMAEDFSDSPHLDK